MTKKKNISNCITLCIQELMRISMECLPLGMFNDGLYLDLLIRVTAVLVSHRCESGPGKHIDGTVCCCWLLGQNTFSMVLLRFFCTKCYWTTTQFNPNVALFAWAVIIAEHIHVKTFWGWTSHVVVCQTSMISLPARCQTASASWKGLHSFSLVFLCRRNLLLYTFIFVFFFWKFHFSRPNCKVNLFFFFFLLNVKTTIPWSHWRSETFTIWPFHILIKASSVQVPYPLSAKKKKKKSHNICDIYSSAWTLFQSISLFYCQAIDSLFVIHGYCRKPSSFWSEAFPGIDADRYFRF